MAQRTNLGFRLVFVAALGFSSTACVSTSLEVPRDHPANAAASTAPLALSQPLAVSPQEPLRDTGEEAPAGHQHGHAEHAAPMPSAGSTSVDAAKPAPSAGVPPSSGSSKSPAADAWSCPMHPDVMRDGPGKCPTCGMNLVKQAKGSQQQGRH